MSNLMLAFITGVFAGVLLAGFTNKPCPPTGEYQIVLDFDTVSIYDGSRFVGSYVIGDTLSPLDSICADDNR